MKKQEFECRICVPSSSESHIRHALEKALPTMRWEEGDSSWDKINVFGEDLGATIAVTRYEGPGPFNLTIVLKEPKGADAENACLALRDTVLRALKGKIWKPLEPQPVLLVKLHGRFPAAYEFESDLGIGAIKQIFDDAEFWYWEAREKEPLGYHLVAHNGVRIVGQRPNYRIEVGHWQDQPGRVRCDQVHETVQNTVLPAIAARSVRAAK